jgi:hypothetical protein
MPTEEAYRTFLLGMSDAETEKTIEEGILDGSIGADELLLIEDELIDDYVFGRLTPDEEKSFDANFLIGQERGDKLDFSRSITKYALERTHGGVLQRWPLLRVLRVTSIGYKWLLLGPALGCIVLTAVWFGVRDISLSRQLDKAVRVSDEREQLLASLTEEQKLRSRMANTADKSSPETLLHRTPTRNAEPEPSIKLAPGLTRGIERIPVLHLEDKARAVWITLELPFKPKGGFREELLRANGELIWSQEFAAPGAMLSHGTTTILLPAKLLSAGDYQIKFKELSTGGTPEGESYVFRVIKG